MNRLHSIYLCLGVYLSGCGDGSQFRGGGMGGTTTEKRSERSSEDQTADDTVAVPMLNEDGSVAPIDSRTDHNELSLSDSVVFGDSTVYRVGDGEVKGTSCIGDVEAYELSGKAYNFAFEVREDDTTLQIKIETLCGVDVNDYNLVFIDSSMGQLQKATLEAAQSNVVMQAIKLNSGTYSLGVQSTKIKKGKYKGHFDDFIVGKIFVNANKKIIPGEITAE